MCVECTEEKMEGEEGALSRGCMEDRHFIQGLQELLSPLLREPGGAPHLCDIILKASGR